MALDWQFICAGGRLWPTAFDVEWNPSALLASRRDIARAEERARGHDAERGPELADVLARRGDLLPHDRGPRGLVAAEAPLDRADVL